MGKGKEKLGPKRAKILKLFNAGGPIFCNVCDDGSAYESELALGRHVQMCHRGGYVVCQTRNCWVVLPESDVGGHKCSNHWCCCWRKMLCCCCSNEEERDGPKEEVSEDH